MKKPVLITENSIHFKKGELLEVEYREVEDGIEINENFIPKSTFVLLTEKLSPEDEKQVRDIIRKKIKELFWNLYTKQSVLVS